MFPGSVHLCYSCTFAMHIKISKILLSILLKKLVYVYLTKHCPNTYEYETNPFIR